MTNSSVSRRIGFGIFFTLFLTYGYFYQGGGWNQNSRFDQIRSIAENHQLEINDYVIYRAVEGVPHRPKLERIALPAGIESEVIPRLANTGDVSVFREKIYPNKPPGTVFTALPAYLVIYRLEQALGIDPDDWWVLTVNAYLTTVFSVSLLSALGGAILYLVSLRLFPSAPFWTHTASAMTYGLGTLVFPFATVLFDHDLVATFSVGVFWLLLVGRQGGFASVRAPMVFLVAGVLSGVTILMNYSSMISAGFLALYAMWVSRTWTNILLFVTGFVLPLMLLAWYQLVCFGSVLANANTYQYELFTSQETAFFGMLGVPQLDVMLQLLFSGYRGLFFTSPVLFFSLLGFWLMGTAHRRWAEIALFGSIFAGFLLMNSAFNHWHAGWTIGPRYLIPTLPFLSLPLTLAFAKMPRATISVAVFSAVVMLVATAVDPQPPADLKNPVKDHIFPLLQGKTTVVNSIRIEGPVSANPIGVYESWSRPVLHTAAGERRWNSFNLGELIWPGRLASLIPLVGALGLGLGILSRLARTKIAGVPHSDDSVKI